MQERVQIVQGTIHIQSAPDEGIYSSLRTYYRKEQKSGHEKLRKPTLLLADDQAIVIDGLRRLLQTDFDLLGAVGDGWSLLEAAEQQAGCDRRGCLDAVIEWY